MASQQQPTPSSDRKQIAALLARLSLHYWRPDYTPEQARLLVEDYLSDLAGYTPDQVRRACEDYRKLPDSKFFPHSGELLALMGHGKYETTVYQRLPTWTTPKCLLEAPRGKTKSVADILREHGYERDAEKWSQ